MVGFGSVDELVEYLREAVPKLKRRHASKRSLLRDRNNWTVPVKDLFGDLDSILIVIEIYFKYAFLSWPSNAGKLVVDVDQSLYSLLFTLEHLLDERGDFIDSIEPCEIRRIGSNNYVFTFVESNELAGWYACQVDSIEFWRDAERLGRLPDAATLYLDWNPNDNFYWVLLHGQNLNILTEEDGVDVEVTKGFYVTRTIKANDLESAKYLATEMVRREVETMFSSGPSNQPNICVERVELETRRFGRVRNHSGYGFYEENEENQRIAQSEMLEIFLEARKSQLNHRCI